MNTGKTLFAQLMDFLPWTTFTRIVDRYGGDHRVRTLSCAEQYRSLAFAQLTYRESLRDIETCLSVHASKLYHMGFRQPVRRSTLADPGAATDNHLVDIATDPDFLMAVGDGHGIVIRPVAHQGQRVDPRALLVARVERCRQWPLQRFAVTHKPFADALAVAAQDVALPVAALLFQVAIEGVPAREPGTRRHDVPPGIADHPLHIAFVVTLAGTAVAVLEEVMGLQPAERPRSLGRSASGRCAPLGSPRRWRRYRG